MTQNKSAAMSSIALFSSCLPGWGAERVIAVAQKLGCAAIEWGVGPDQAVRGPRDGQRVSELCAEAGIRTVGLSVQDRELALTAPWRQTQAQLDLARTLGAGQVRLFAEPFGGGSLAQARRRHVRALDRLVDHAAPAGVKILVETSPGTPAPSPELALALVGHQPPTAAGVLYDPGNMIIEGDLTPTLAVSLLGRHLGHVHVKNIVWSRHAGQWQWRYATLASGRVRWAELVGALRAAGYDGWYSLDHLPGRPSESALAGESGELAQLLADGGAR